MTESTLLLIAREGLYLSLLLSLPALISSLVVGAVVGLFQAATRLQEQSLSVVPRLVAVMLAVALFGGWMGSQLMSYTTELWQLFGQIQL